MELEILHYPNLKTILMVEENLKTANIPVRREELKKTLPKQVMHQTLNIILAYLEQSGKIIDSRQGIVWIHNQSKALDLAIREGREFKSESFLAIKQMRRTKTSKKQSKKSKKSASKPARIKHF